MRKAKKAFFQLPPTPSDAGWKPAGSNSKEPVSHKEQAAIIQQIKGGDEYNQARDAFYAGYTPDPRGRSGNRFKTLLQEKEDPYKLPKAQLTKNELNKYWGINDPDLTFKKNQRKFWGLGSEASTRSGIQVVDGKDGKAPVLDYQRAAPLPQDLVQSTLDHRQIKFNKTASMRETYMGPETRKNQTGFDYDIIAGCYRPPQ